MQISFTEETKAIYEHIAQSVGEAKYKIWFKSSSRFTLTEQGLDIAVPNSFIASWIENHFAKAIRDAMKAVTGSEGPVQFSIDSTL
ncbi:MAG: DnaA N-terminal domain-containing protein, partial [Anaerohalosphaeraceae bacterium]